MFATNLDRLAEWYPTNAARYSGAAVVLLVFYVLTKLIYNVYFHPLASYPGPFWAAASRVWYVNTVLRGTLPFTVHRLHQKYGPVVRIAPDELAYIDPEAWKDIYGFKPGKNEVPKDPNFYLNTAAGHLSIIAAPAQRHGELRRLLSHGFSDKAIRDQIPIIQGYVDLLIRRLRDLSVKDEAINIVQWFDFFAFDVIGDLGFGESFGCLEASHYHPWIDAMAETIVLGSFARCTDYYPIVKALLKLFIPKALKESMNKHVSFMKAKGIHRLNMKTDRLDFMTRMARPDSGVSAKEFIASADIVILGGSETTSTLLSGCTYLLLKNPDKLEKLVQEVRGRFKSEEEIDMPSVNTLDYMLACLDEAFRLYPPVPGGLPRRTVEGDIICGKYVPPNTTLAIYQWAMYRNPKYFSRVEEYIPERWLGDERFADDNRSVLQPFSYGARNCVGRNLAYVEMRLVLARLLFNFDIEATPEVEGWMNQGVHLLWHKHPLKIKLRARDVKLRPQVVELAKADVAKATEAQGLERQKAY